MMIVYGSIVSPFVRKLLGFLGEKGLDFELKGVGIGDPLAGERLVDDLVDRRGHAYSLRVR